MTGNLEFPDNAEGIFFYGGSPETLADVAIVGIGETLSFREPEDSDKEWAYFNDDDGLYLTGTPNFYLNGAIYDGIDGVVNIGEALAVNGAITGTTLDTGQGAQELYGRAVDLLSGSGISITGGGDNVLYGPDGDITITHADTSSQASVNNSNGVVIQDITLDAYGHLSGLASIDLDTRYARTSGTGSYIQNQNAAAQSANFYINGSGRVGSLTSDGNIDLNNNDLTDFDDLISRTDAVFPIMRLDSAGTGDEWTSQGAYISLGEDAATDNTAALYITYRGNGYSYIGSGGGVTADGIPDQAYWRFFYANNTIYSNGNVDIDGRTSSDGFTNDGTLDQNDTADFSTSVSIHGALAMNSQKITALATPTAGTDAANKAYVDGLIGSESFWSRSGSSTYLKNSADYVGIGMTTASAKLHLRGTLGGDGNWAEGSILLENTNTAAGETVVAYKNVDTGTNFWFAGMNQKAHFDLAYGPNFVDDNVKFRIQDNGYVGIGTTIPATQLHTTGTIRFEGAGTPANGRVLTSDASGNATWQAVSAGSHTHATLTRSTGLLGSNYDGSTATSWSVDFGTGSSQAARGNHGHTNMVTGSGTATRVAFWNGTNTLSSNTDLYWDNTNSRLGIGTTIPAQKLDVHGAIAFGDASTWKGVLRKHSGLSVALAGYTGLDNPLQILADNDLSESLIIGRTGNGDAQVAFGFSVGSTPRMTIFGNGNVGIGTVIPATQLHTTGTIRFEGAGTPANGRVLTSDASGNATWQVVSAGSHNHDSLYVNVTGDAMTGELQFKDGAYLDDDAILGGVADDWIHLNGYIEMRSNTDSFGIVLRDKDADTGDYFAMTQVAGASYLADSDSYGNYFLMGDGANATVRGNLTVTGGSLYMGADTEWRRESANQIYTPDNLNIDGRTSSDGFTNDGTLDQNDTADFSTSVSIHGALAMNSQKITALATHFLCL